MKWFINKITWVLRLLESRSTLANPKSAILMIPLWMRMLAGLRSLWTMFFSLRCLNPLTSCLMMYTLSETDSLLSLFCWRYPSRLPPSQNSMIRYRLLLDFFTSNRFTMWMWVDIFIDRISFLRDCISYSLFLCLFMKDNDICFTAIVFSVSFSIPR